MNEGERGQSKYARFSWKEGSGAGVSARPVACDRCLRAYVASCCGGVGVWWCSSSKTYVSTKGKVGESCTREKV